MRVTTSAIWSESARDSLMASPNSFIRFFNCWSTNPPSRRICVYWMPAPGPPLPLRGILNREVVKIECDDECLHRAEIGHCSAGRREANKGLPDLRGGAGWNSGHSGAFCRGGAAALARDYGLPFPGDCRVWRGGAGQGVSGLSRGRGKPESHGGGCGLY